MFSTSGVPRAEPGVAGARELAYALRSNELWGMA